MDKVEIIVGVRGFKGERIEALDLVVDNIGDAQLLVALMRAYARYKKIKDPRWDT